VGRQKKRVVNDGTPRPKLTMTRIAQLIVKVRPAYKLEDVMRLTHRQIMTLLEPDRSGQGVVACGSYAEAKALSERLIAEEGVDDE